MLTLDINLLIAWKKMQNDYILFVIHSKKISVYIRSLFMEAVILLSKMDYQRTKVDEKKYHHGTRTNYQMMLLTWVWYTSFLV